MFQFFFIIAYSIYSSDCLMPNEPILKNFVKYETKALNNEKGWGDWGTILQKVDHFNASKTDTFQQVSSECAFDIYICSICKKKIVRYTTYINYITAAALDRSSADICPHLEISSCVT